MAIAKLPKRKQDDESAAVEFIARAGAAPPAPPAPAPEPKPTEEGRKPTMIRFDARLLARIDRAAKRNGVSRSAWIAMQLTRTLDAEGER